MRQVLFVTILVCWSATAMADGEKFSTNLFAKFQTKGCTKCHDYYEQGRGGLAFSSHKERSPEMCSACHQKGVTGFANEDDWFAQPGLYFSGMNAKQTCETVEKAMHGKFKSRNLLGKQLEKHLFEDPRVLWGIEGATPQSGALPKGKREDDLVKGGLTVWKEQVSAWIRGGMLCQ